MSRFNKFGATADEVVAMYPGSVLADFDGGGDSGETIIEGVLDRISREVALALSPEAYAQMTQVDCMEVVRYATQSQTSFNLGLAPAVAGTLHLWIYPSLASLELRTSGYADTDGLDDLYRKPVMGVNEIPAGNYSESSEVITYPSGLSLGQRVFASYDVDMDSVEMPSMADVVLLGTAAELGSRLYSDATQEWKLVATYAENYKTHMAMIFEGKWIPDEIRALNYFNEVERKSDSGVSSVRLYRA